MTLIQRQKVIEGADQPANDNRNRILGSTPLSDVDNEDAITALVRRTERTAILVVLGMGGWLMLIPVIYLVMTHGM